MAAFPTPQIGGSIHVPAQLELPPVQIQPLKPSARDRHHPRPAPGDAGEQARLRAPQSNQQVTAVLRRPHHGVGPLTQRRQRRPDVARPQRRAIAANEHRIRRVRQRRRQRPVHAPPQIPARLALESRRKIAPAAHKKRMAARRRAPQLHRAQTAAYRPGERIPHHTRVKTRRAACAQRGDQTGLGPPRQRRLGEHQQTRLGKFEVHSRPLVQARQTARIGAQRVGEP